MRDPTDGEIEVTDGAAQTVDFGEHANKTYEEVLTKNPQYAAYLMAGDQLNHYGPKKFAKRINRQKRGNS